MSRETPERIRPPADRALGHPQSSLASMLAPLRVERAEVVAKKAQDVLDAMKLCGCTLNNAFMQHSLLALVVIPELRISDMGLVDVTAFRMTELIVS